METLFSDNRQCNNELVRSDFKKNIIIVQEKKILSKDCETVLRVLHFSLKIYFQVSNLSKNIFKCRIVSQSIEKQA